MTDVGTPRPLADDFSVVGPYREPDQPISRYLFWEDSERQGFIDLDEIIEMWSTWSTSSKEWAVLFRGNPSGGPSYFSRSLGPRIFRALQRYRGQM